MLATAVVAIATLGLQSQSESARGVTPALEAAYGKLPLTFEANQGQTGPQVKFLLRGRGYTAFLTSGGMTISLRANSPTTGSNSSVSTLPVSKTVQLALTGAAANPVVTGEELQPGKVNYFLGNDRTKWHTNVPIYARVRYHDVYPGIDLVYYGNHREMEYDFEVRPGSDPGKIRFEVQGASGITLDQQGDLVLTIGRQELHLASPFVYQFANGQKVAVGGTYVITDSNHFAFQVPQYDASKSLVVDPALVYATYTGGSGFDQTTGLAVDSTGNVYLEGYTSSVDFPLAALGSLASNAYHAFVTKLDSTGSNLVYSDYVGGNTGDYGAALALDSANEVYLTGSTASSDFPAVNAFQSEQPGPYTGFLTKISADGSSILYSTYLGGNAFDQPTSIGIDGSGEPEVAGFTMSQNFPVSNAYQATALANQGGIFGTYGFLTKFSADGASLVYSTYVEGSSNQTQPCGSDSCWPAPYNAINAMTVDSSGNAYVGGTTNTYDFPVTNGAYQTTNSTQQDPPIGFVSKFDASGTLDYSTYFYGSGGNSVGISAIAVDGSGSAYISGATESDGTFPITTTTLCDPGSYGSSCGYAFVTKFDPTASTLVYSTFLGPNNYAIPQALTVDASGDAYVLASTSSAQYQTNLAIENYSNASDLLLVEIDPSASSQLFSTYLGGSGNDSPGGLMLDASNNIYVAGYTDSTDFPVTQGAFQGVSAGETDAFVMKISNSSSQGASLSPGALEYSPQAVGSNSQSQQVQFRNMSSQPLTITSISISGDFTQSNNCGSSLDAAGSCSLFITFTPTAVGARTGSLLISDSASDNAQVLSMNGNGLGPVASVSPAALTFSSTAVGVSSPSQAITLANQGNESLDVNSIQATGDFSETNNCPSTLGAGLSCTISVTFTPTIIGGRTGSVVVSDAAAGSPQSVGLSGTGVLGSSILLTPASLTFPSTPITTSSTAQTITVKNQSNASVSISSVQAGGDYTQTNTCAGTLGAGSSCTINVTFVPTSSGTRNGTLTVNDSAAGSPQTLGLSGTGADFSLSSSSTSNTIKAGSAATYALSVAPVGGAFTNSIKISCSGQPANSTCTVSPSQTTPGGNITSASVTVSTTAASADNIPAVPSTKRNMYAGLMRLQGLAVLGLALAGLGRRKQKIGLVVLLIVLISGVVGMSACAGGTGISQQGGSGTTPGTYSITVTGASGNLQHSLTLTLVVQ